MSAGSLTRTFSVRSGSSLSQTAQPSSISTSPQRVTCGMPRKAAMMGPGLGGLGVGGVAAADQQVVVAELLGRLGERIARGQRVGAAEGAVGEQRGFVAAHGQRLLERLLGLRRTHRDRSHGAAVRLAQPQRRLHGVGVEGLSMLLTPSRQRFPVLGSSLTSSVSGTCFTNTIIFILTSRPSSRR